MVGVDGERDVAILLAFRVELLVIMYSDTSGERINRILEFFGIFQRGISTNFPATFRIASSRATSALIAGVARSIEIYHEAGDETK